MIHLLNATLPTYTELNKVKELLKKLGIAEVLIATVCIIIGAVVAADAATPRGGYIYINMREGVWGGIFIMVAGVLGIMSGKEAVTPCIINNNLAFSICGSTVALIMTGISAYYAAAYSVHKYTLGIAMEALIAVLGFVAFGLCFTSAKYCTQATDAAGLAGCCGGGCGSEELVQNGGNAQNRNGNV